MVLLDAIARRLPGALSDGSGELESFSSALDGGIEYPHYTRPAEYRGWDVPRGAALRRPRADRALAAGAEPGQERWVSGIDERDVPPGTEADADGTPTAPTERPTGFFDTDDHRPARTGRVRLADDARRDPARRPAPIDEGRKPVVGGRAAACLDTGTRGTRSTA